MAVPHLSGTRTSECAKVDRCVWPYHFQTACYSAEHWSEKEGDQQAGESVITGLDWTELAFNLKNQFS